MEPSTLPPLPGQPALPGELVVRNGRLSGARRPLNDPLTLIGQAAACDVRLNVEGVGPLHCAILLDPGGPILRDLGTPGGTRVNGEPVVTRRLLAGDVIEVGPFQFTLDLGSPPTRELPSADALGIHGESLRVQAAAVAAQQAALTEQEARLEQRAAALARQEEQLAAHLEQRQRDLDEQEARLQADRDEFQAQCAARSAAIEAQEKELAGARAAVEQEREEALARRRRVVVLWRRLRQRWKQHFKQREADLARREADLDADRQRVQRERAVVAAFQQRVNGELELGRRQLREEWRELGLAQQQWDATLNQEQAEQVRRRQDLEALAAQVTAARQALLTEQEQARHLHARLSQEAEGLEARIRNQRARLDALQHEAARLAAPPPPVPTEPIIPAPAAPAPAGPAWPARLRELAGELQDQRARLGEQWQRLLEVQERWQQERSLALEELEQNAASLARRERGIVQAEQDITTLRAAVQQQREGLVRSRAAIEAWQARLASQETSWQVQREALLGDLERRERLLERRREQLEEVQRRRNRRRQEEVAALASARQRCEEARRQYSSLWQECERLRGELVRREQALAGRGLALDRYRQELVNQAPDSARAEARLVRLERRETAPLEGEVRHLQAQRDLLEAERRRLDELAGQLQRQGDELAEQQRQWQEQLGNWEMQQAAVQAEEQQRREELRRLRARQALDERQLRQLREQLESIARVLIEEAEGPVAPPAQQAA